MSADSDTFLTCLRKVSKRMTHRGHPYVPLRLKHVAVGCSHRSTRRITVDLLCGGDNYVVGDGALDVPYEI